jgi:hypothetical protein
MTGMADQPKRYWFYRQWSGWWPMLASDEYGRRTLVLTLPGFGAVVFALRTCRCEFCEQSRAETLEASR